jgi:hypothetical protein
MTSDDSVKQIEKRRGFREIHSPDRAAANAKRPGKTPALVTDQ